MYCMRIPFSGESLILQDSLVQGIFQKVIEIHLIKMCILGCLCGLSVRLLIWARS